MVFISKEQTERERLIGERIFRETGERVGFAATVPFGKRGKRITSSPITRGPILRTKRSDSIIQGGTRTERRAVNIAESALSPSERRRAEQSKKDRFCKIVVKKGKRVRVCKVRTPKKKTKTKPRPRQNNLFGKELFG